MAVIHPSDVGRPVASTKQAGICYFDSTDFSVAVDGKVSLSGTGALENLLADSGTVTPSSGQLTIAGGEGIDTSGSGATVTIAMETATTTNVGGLETATDAEAQAKTATDKMVVPANLAAEGFLQYADVTLSNSEIKNLAATQIELVAAQGAGTIIQFMGATLKLNYGSNAFTESADNLVIKYVNASGAAASEVIECTGFIDATADTYTFAIPVKDPIIAAATGENAALVIDNNGDGEFGGNAANDNTIDVRVYYLVHSI